MDNGLQQFVYYLKTDHKLLGQWVAYCQIDFAFRSQWVEQYMNRLALY